MRASNHKHLQKERKKYRPLWIALSLSAMIICGSAGAQTTQHISLKEAIRLGLDNSKQLKLSNSKIDEAIASYQQTLDKRLPTMKATAMASEAFIPTHKFQLKGAMDEPLNLPKNSTLYLGTFSVSEAIFAGNKLRYAKESADILKKIAELNAGNDKEAILFNIVSAYINLYKIDESRKIVSQNLQDVQGRLEETQKFEEQGLATLNDVLRFQLEKSNIQLTEIDLENNRQVANYAMNILLGLPDTTTIAVDSVILRDNQLQPLDHYIGQALINRKDLATWQYQHRLTDLSIKNINADKLPSLGAGVNLYYINPNTAFFPPANGFLVPVTVGLNLGWNISSLYTSKHKVQEEKVKQFQVETGKSVMEDNIRIETNKQYRAYTQTLEKIKVLETAVKQAVENDRILESKFKNQLATTTDRIDAQTLLYQSRINLELAKADAEIAYYNLLKSTGTLVP